MNWTKAGDFNATGLKTTIPAGTVNAPGKVTLASRTIPSGAKARLKLWSAKVTDVGNADQIYLAITRNGLPIQSGMDRVPGVQFDFQPQIEIDVELQPGLIEVIGYNISGMSATIEPDALAVGVAIAAQAWWTGDLLSQRGGI